ncbi:MAG: ATP-binding protein [Thiovulaceae bacterium]|nr:ATP-binding protein [Sulfurimonadaceae bacterium]
MQTEKRIKFTMLSLLFIIVSLSGAVTIYYQYSLVKKNFEKNINKLHENIHYSYYHLLDKMKKDMATKTDFVINEKVKKAFYQKDREKLLKIVTPFYQRMSTLNHLKIMTFRLADGSAFARIHKPAMYGDALRDNRKIIKDTNSLKKRLFGFEVGKLKMTYRVVTPIFYKERYIGLVEMGIEPEHIIKDIRNQFQMKDALFLKKADSSGFIFARGDKVFKVNQQMIDFKNTVRVRTKDGHNYLFDSDLNLLDHKDNIAAKMLLAYNIDAYEEDVNSAVKDILINVLILMFAMFLILNYFIKYFTEKMRLLNRQLVLKSHELQKINSTLKERVDFEVEKNREQDKHMFEQSRMAQMGEMISMIAHQWRQPLASIASATANVRIKMELKTHDLSLESGRIEHEKHLRESLDHIEVYVQNLSSTINDFRNFYKPNKEAIKTLLSQSVEKALFIIKDTLDADGIKLLEHYRNQKKITLYENEIMQVILSILHNAQDNFNFKAIKEPAISIEVNDNPKGVRIEICDNGGGIIDEILPKIFDPYFSTKEERNGTGLGLYMSKTIIEEHHKGTILATNKEDGVCFVIEILDDV